MQVRHDAIFASGRFDYPNQVNNVLAVPSVFRSALDVRATRINWEMKLAASRAIAGLARQLPEFGPQCILPRALDPRVLPRVASAVADAAVKSGAARRLLLHANAYVKAVTNRVREAGGPRRAELHQSRRLGADVSYITGGAKWQARR